VLSLSWGNPEAEWSGAAIAAANETFHDAAALGITVCASAGDEGATAGEQGLAVEFPASSPYVLGCGGTRLLARRDTMRSEVVWNDLAAGFGATGGGLSARFPRPRYQGRIAALRGKPRGVPDVAGDADPETGYRVRVDGRWLRLGGTSAVAPLWAALVARLNQALGRRLGWLAPRLYPLKGTRAFGPVTRGDNGGYRAGRGWNACTGLGTPRGGALLRALSSPRRRSRT
jgi:kumamolisin